MEYVNLSGSCGCFEVALLGFHCTVFINKESEIYRRITVYVWLVFVCGGKEKAKKTKNALNGLICVYYMASPGTVNIVSRWYMTLGMIVFVTLIAL